MASTGFLITTGGQAAATVANPGGPYINIVEFRAGSAVNYTPVGYVPGVSATSQNALVGSTLYTSAPTTYTVVDADTIELTLVIPPTVSSFNFGELGIYLAGGVLFAICVFDSLQEHVHAVGNQAGTTWKIRARLRLAQIPAICNVTLINSQSLLEVPNWQSLLRPDLQPTAANAAIVHDNNGSDDPVFVVRDSNTEWGLVGYSRTLLGSVSDGGASSTTTSFTHPGIAALSFEMPNTTSKYLIKFSDGSIRKITGNPSGTQVTWTPALGAAPTGVTSIWQEGGSGSRIAWADTFEYNNLVNDINPWWVAPTGSFPTNNRGLNQVALPLLTRRTNITDWTEVYRAVRALCAIHNINRIPIATPSDFAYPVQGISPPAGLQTLSTKWTELLYRFGLATGNYLNFTLAAQDFNVYTSYDDATYYSTRNYDFTFDFSSDAHRLAMLNGGHQLTLRGAVITPTNPSWVQQNDLWNLIDTLTITDDQVLYNGAGNGSVNVYSGTSGLARINPGPGWTNQFFISDANGWFIQIQGQINGTNDIVIRIIVGDTIAPVYGYAGSPGTTRFNWTGSRPSATWINTPILAFPTMTVVQS